MSVIAKKLCCECNEPRETVNPRRPGTCVKCGKPFDPEWVSSDETFAAFFDRLAESMAVVPPEFETFRAQCAKRERAGRETFGFRYLSRENTTDAYEEACDGANYMLFNALQKVKEGYPGEDIDADLTAAWKFYEAWSAAARAYRKHHHSP